MGDAGSLAMGATLAVIALITGQILILPLIGLVFVVETLSVVLQVGYFKLTHGRRIFRMSPAPPPLRAGRLARDEDHPPLLDRGGPVRAARDHPLPRQPAEAGVSVAAGFDLDRLDLGGRPQAGPCDGVRSRFSASPERGSRWPASSPTQGRGSPSTTASRPRTCAGAVGAGGPPGEARLRTRRRPGDELGRGCARRLQPLDHARASRRRSRACGPRSTPWLLALPAASRMPRCSSPSPTCSCGSARRPRSGSPGRRARRRHRRSRRTCWRPTRATRSSWAATSGPPSSIASARSRRSIASSSSSRSCSFRASLAARRSPSTRT